jgi:hypothetical protein
MGLSREGFEASDQIRDVVIWHVGIIGTATK